MTKGARDMLSTPPAMMTSAAPSRMVRAAVITASSPEAVGAAEDDLVDGQVMEVEKAVDNQGGKVVGAGLCE
jgi:hypothetical protein